MPEFEKINKEEMLRLIARQIHHHEDMIKELQEDWKELNFRNIQEVNSCKTCEHLEGCTIELLNDNVKPEKHICENWTKQEVKK